MIPHKCLNCPERILRLNKKYCSRYCREYMQYQRHKNTYSNKHSYLNFYSKQIARLKQDKIDLLRKIIKLNKKIENLEEAKANMAKIKFNQGETND